MTNEQKFEQEIESAVATYLRGCREVANGAMQRALASAGAPAARAESAKARSKQTERQQRRSAADLAVLGEKLIAAVHELPGETMKTLALRVGASPRELQGTVLRLKREGSLRVVGKRQFSRYFPATETSQEMAA